MRLPSSGHWVELGRGFLFQKGHKIDFGFSPTLIIPLEGLEKLFCLLLVTERA